MNQKINAAENGTAIIIVMSVLATLMVVVGVAFEYTMNVGRNVQRTNRLGSAIALADGCLEYNFAQWRDYCRKPGVPKPPTTAELSALSLPTATQFPDIPGFTATRNSYDPTSNVTVQECRVEAVDPQLQALPKGADPVATPDVGDGNVLTYNYRAYASVTLPSRGGNLVAKVQRIFQQRRESVFNYAIFYVDPLEIHPGAALNVTGWVHTNSDLYTGHNLLNFSQKATYSGDWAVGFDQGSTTPFRPADTSHIKETPTAPTGVAPTAESTTHQPSNIDPATFNASDPNNTGYHELIEPPVPSGSPDPFADARYYNQAGVIIEIDANNNITIERGNGDGTATILTKRSTGNDKLLFDMFNGAITTNAPILDNREAASVRLATLDVSRITLSQSNAVNKVGWKAGAAFNGTVYINDKSAAANGVGAKRGIRIANGTLIPAKGLTVASPNPVYIQGDFNTGLNPPSNSGDPSQPQAANYTRQPCSVVADAVNILSNAWNDANAGTKPTASPTTINSAIVSGNVTNGSGFVYSGGAENFPRFLENWSGQAITYYGSMVQLYQSQQSIGVWGKPNVYDAPTRKWFFDTNFKLNMPPGADVFNTYTYSKGRWSLVP
ncbi:MAG: hypothetical protein ABI992_02730 [Chthoniobacterales bacterium]